ncbi:MAG TPA: MASE1 domain-containing protein, partial [Gemmatimonadaceae bacterium]|nr:MASE1 domain-containing protein [Gemmatimonadaceae bacterium]
YVLAALAGLSLDAVAGFASLVWPPTGIALAAVLLLGWRIWPGIFVGALVANLITGAPFITAVGIGIGNTLEALAGGYALTRVRDFRLSLDGVRDVLALIVLAAGLATMISATIGVSTLFLSSLVADANYGETWLTWWIGDAIGALLVAPVILTWLTPPRLVLSRRRLLEAALLMLGVVVASAIVFWSPAVPGGEPLIGAYVFFPLLMWAAIRFGQRGAVTTSVIVSAFAIIGTAMRRGPFVYPSMHESLFALQSFMGITAAAFLILGASTAERDRSREQFRRARDTAAGANRAKSEFLAVMSHELRTPLNAIAGYAELLSVGVDGDLNDKQRDAVDRIRTNQQHLLALIDDVLSFAKIEAGNTRIDIQSVRVCEIVASVEVALRPEITKRQLTLVMSQCDPDLQVRGDPVKVRQILTNILGNSLKFTPPNGRIELSVDKDGDVARMRVSDTGIGIPHDMIDRVFEPFVQVHAGTTREYSGTGLGLAISRDFARAMGGDIRIESEPGKGSVVTVELPLA